MRSNSRYRDGLRAELLAATEMIRQRYPRIVTGTDRAWPAINHLDPALSRVIVQHGIPFTSPACTHPLLLFHQLYRADNLIFGTRNNLVRDKDCLSFDESSVVAYVRPPLNLHAINLMLPISEPKTNAVRIAQHIESVPRIASIKFQCFFDLHHH